MSTKRIAAGCARRAGCGRSRSPAPRAAATAADSQLGLELQSGSGKKIQDDADRRRQGRRVLHHDELRGPGRGQGARRQAGLPGTRTSSTPAQQTPIVNAVAAKKPDAVLIAPTDTKALYAPIKQLADGGSKIVLVDTTLDQPDMAVSQISSDNEGGGKTAADDAGEADRRQGQGLRRQRQAGHLDHRRAREGLRGGREGGRPDVPRPAVQQRRPGEGAASITSPCWPRTPTSRASSPRTCSPPRAPRPASSEAGKPDQVKIVGFDAGPKQVADLKAGTVQALIAQKPADIGAQGVQQAYAALTGKRHEAEDRHRVRVAHEGQPRREPGRRLQGVLLNAPAVRAATDRSGPKPNGGRGVGQACPRVAPSPRRSPRWRALWRSSPRPRPGWPPRRRSPRWPATPGRGRR